MFTGGRKSLLAHEALGHAVFLRFVEPQPRPDQLDDIEALIDKLEDDEDVQAVYTNVA